MTQLPPEWLGWIDSNIARGVPQQTLIDTLVLRSFPPELAARAVRSRAPGFLLQNPKAVLPPQPSAQVLRALAANGLAPGGVPAPVQAMPAVPDVAAASSVSASRYVHHGMALKMGNSVTIDGHKIGVVMKIERPHLIVFENVLSKAECAQLIALSRPRLFQSTAVDTLTGKPELHPNRRSEGTHFDLKETPFLARIDERLAQLMQLPMAHCEGTEILHYAVGGEYKPHYDYYPPDIPGSAAHIAQGGQRVSTLVVYLNTVPEGGETIFPEIDLAVAAVQGRAVYFSYHNSFGDVDPLTYHGGNPVIAGDKWIATKWVRERVQG